MSEDGGGDDFAVPRDAGGRYVPGSSGNPAGKPRGCLNHATRIAVALLEGEAAVLFVRLGALLAVGRRRRAVAALR
jgi:hypothetical protein